VEGISTSINLLALPILGGYWFQYKFYGTHYRAERLTPQRLVFHAGLYALGLLIVAKLLVFVGDSPGAMGYDAIQFLLFSITPAFLLLVFASLIAIGVRAYPGLTQHSDLESDAQHPGEEIYRAGLGAILALLLGWTSLHIESAIEVLPAAQTRVACVVVLGGLFGIAWIYQQFINRFMSFPFFSIGLRIGLFGLVASLALIDFFDRYQFLNAWWDQFVHLKGSGVPMVACLLGLVVWWPLNLLYPHQAANLRLHEQQATTALDRLLYQASLEQNLLSISMADGKVYIGYIQQLPPNPEDRNSYFEILPMNSGYRDKDTREMKLTTFYDTAYQTLVDTEAGPDAWLAFVKVLKIDDIVSAGRFDPDAYLQMQGEVTEEHESAGTDNGSG